MPGAALLALALAAQTGDPCVLTDGRGRTFHVCFDPGSRFELTVGGAFGGAEPVRGGATVLGAAVRLRSDLRTRSGDVEWLRDMTLGEGRVLLDSATTGARAAHVLVWRGEFVRHRASPFLLVPGPRPLRLPFPFDVGLLVEVGDAAWDASRSREAELRPIRSALLLDVAGHGALRRLAFGPELSWRVRVSKDAGPVHGIVPFSAGVVDARAESRDGLLVAQATFRAGTVVSVQGGSSAFCEGSAAVERILVALNDRPFAIYVEGAARGGGGAERAAEVGVGIRVGAWNGR